MKGAVKSRGSGGHRRGPQKTSPEPGQRQWRGRRKRSYFRGALSGLGAGLSVVRGRQGMCAMEPRPHMSLLTTYDVSQKLQKRKGLTRLMTVEFHLFPYLGSRV